MKKVIIEQFNPETGNWNKLYEVDESEFDSSEPYKIDKYGGPHRTRIVGDEIIDYYIEPAVDILINSELDVGEDVFESEDKNIESSDGDYDLDGWEDHK